MVITIGGDGTILWAHKLLDRQKLPPFVCFDGGSLCFLSNFSIKKLEKVLNHLHSKIVKNDPFDTFPLTRVKSFVRNNLKIMKFRKKGEENSEPEEVHFALNEVVIERRTPNVVKLDVFVNDTFACTLNADGMLVSSSTGSTAYNMSMANAVAMHPLVNCIIINPFNPLSLSIRPLVLPDTVNITVRVKVSVIIFS